MKRSVAVIILIACLCAGLQAQPVKSVDDESVFSEEMTPLFRSAGSNGLAPPAGWLDTRQLSVSAGVWRAYWADVTYDSGYSQQYLFDPTYLVSVGFRYFFSGSNLGFGIDGVFMDSHKESYTDGNGAPATATITHWLLDINLYYRHPLTRSINLMAGGGLTCNYVDMGGLPNAKDEFSSSGWNLKVGGELFVSHDVSFSLFATYHSFRQGAIIAGAENKNANVKLTSFMLMMNFYL
jgi:hypothetical protein